MAVALLCLLLTQGADPAVRASDPSIDTVVVCPHEFRQALAPWLAHREAQGHQVALIPNQATAAELRDEIRRIAADHAVRFLVLVGDADPPGSRRPGRMSTPSRRTTGRRKSTSAGAPSRRSPPTTGTRTWTTTACPSWPWDD